MKKLVPLDAQLIPLEAELAFKGILFDIFHWQQKIYDGTTKTFEMPRRLDSAVVVALHEGKVVILNEQQPQWPEPRLSLPGGRPEHGEDPLLAAKRELLEETGYIMENWRLIQIFQPDSKIERFIYVYLAQNSVEHRIPQIDSDEKMEVWLMEFEEAKSNAMHERRLKALNEYNSMHDLLSAPEPQTKIVEVID